MTYKLFDNFYEERIHPIGNGFQKLYKFDNGYGASVIRFKIPGRKIGNGYGSYTDNENEFELAVLRFRDKEYNIDYTTKITSNVLGHLSKDEVEKYLKKIKSL